MPKVIKMSLSISGLNCFFAIIQIMISGANSSNAPTIFGSLTISRQSVLLKVMQDIFFSIILKIAAFD